MRIHQDGTSRKPAPTAPGAEEATCSVPAPAAGTPGPYRPPGPHGHSLGCSFPTWAVRGRADRGERGVQPTSTTSSWDSWIATSPSHGDPQRQSFPPLSAEPMLSVLSVLQVGIGGQEAPGTDRGDAAKGGI